MAEQKGCPRSPWIRTSARINSSEFINPIDLIAIDIWDVDC